MASQQRTGLNLSNILNTSWGWTGGWQRLRSPAAVCTPSPRPSRCRTRTGTGGSAAGAAGLSIHRWPWCIPRWDPSASPWPHSRTPQFSRAYGPSSLCGCRWICSGQVESDSLPVLTSPLGHKVIFHQGSQPRGLTKLRGVRRVVTSLSRSLPPSPVWLSLFLPPPHPSNSFLLLPAHQLFSICVSSPHESNHVRRGRSGSH